MRDSNVSSFSFVAVLFGLAVINNDGFYKLYTVLMRSVGFLDSLAIQ